MSYLEELYRKNKWYVSHEILFLEIENDPTEDEIEVWENLILIKAESPEEAYQKAMKHGVDSEDDVGVNGRKGRLKFKGLKDLVLIYDDLEDGAEIEWHQSKVRRTEFDGMLKPKMDMHAFNPAEKMDEN
jgi:hypothetical protein